MVQMAAGRLLVETVAVVAAVVVASHPSSYTETAAGEFLAAAIVPCSSAGREKYLLVNLTNNGSTSAVCSAATENVDL